MPKEYPSPGGMDETIKMLRAMAESMDIEPKKRALAAKIIGFMTDGLEDIGAGLREIDRIGMTPDTQALMDDGMQKIRQASDLMSSLES